ncbi:MAG: polyprenyl diphosphate synthase [Candidatus Omnitrophota bacterium]
MRIPGHIGIIPDGNRRWAERRGSPKEDGYENGLMPGLQLFKLCKETGIREMTFYGFTVDNTKRSSEQTTAFTKACVKAVELLSHDNASLLVIGDTSSPKFPRQLLPFTKRIHFGNGGIKVNFLVNYGWQWDLANLNKPERKITSRNIGKHLNSADISRIELIIRWGGRRRLSGFLPVQTVYSDIYVIDDYWPDFKPDHFFKALEWYNTQDVTLGG